MSSESTTTVSDDSFSGRDSSLSPSPPPSSPPTSAAKGSSISPSSNPLKRYKCPQCDLCFRRAEHLARHVMTHSGDKPFPCSRCGRGFSRVDALRRHARIHSAEAVNLFARIAQPAGQVAAAAESTTTTRKSATTSRSLTGSTRSRRYPHSDAALFPILTAAPSTPTVAATATRQYPFILPTPPAPAPSPAPAMTAPPTAAATEKEKEDAERPLPAPKRRKTTAAAVAIEAIPRQKHTPARGSGICPAQLRHLATLSVTLVCNADRAMYQCPVRGCNSLLNSHHLSHHLESKPNTLVSSHSSSSSSSSVSHHAVRSIQCSALATRDLVAYVDHILERHAIVGSFCRDCETTHTRDDYYSFEHAPTVVPACGDSKGSTTTMIPARATLQAVLAGAIHLGHHHHNDDDDDAADTFSITATASDADSESDDAASSIRNNDPSRCHADDPLLTLAMCAADELARFSPLASSAITTPHHHHHHHHRAMTAFDSHRVRIQDLIN
ncbi:hypothetical protein PhCBS80983_g04622 [Powellomyces hirtus]|uniref:C2H2-type domain-containing protein n=1 Tax=Powellomyces hirtus TaxID=109895 RepID=A0A507DWY6_9FUNG|nr:hypothetical protein PhCBS80983_g04622 [Powellomyces hirtus]